MDKSIKLGHLLYNSIESNYSNVNDIKAKVRFLNYNLNQNNTTAYDLRKDVILDDLSRKLDAEIIFADEGFEIEEDGVKLNNNKYEKNNKNSTTVLIRKLALLQTDDFSDEKLKRKRDMMTNNYLDPKMGDNNGTNLVMKTNKGEIEIKSDINPQGQNMHMSNSNTKENKYKNDRNINSQEYP